MTRRRIGHFRRLIRDLWFFKVTPPGRLMALALILAAQIGLLTLDVPIYHLFGALMCLVVVASLGGLLCWPRLRVSGELPDRASVGRAVTVVFTLTNRSRRAAYDVSLGFFDLPKALRQVSPAATIRRLGAGESADLSLQLMPLRRGLHEFDSPRYFTTFPFNLFRSGPRHTQTCSLMVLPSFHPITTVDIPVTSRYQPGGIALTSHVGESPEYIGSREYRPGDSMRRIDFRSWARLASPAVREYQEEYYCRVGLVFDTYIPRGRVAGLRGFVNLEAAVSLSAAVAEAMSRGEYVIDIFAAGPELHVFRSGRHTAHFENVLEILACIQESRLNPFDTVVPALAEELANISTVICVLLDWDQTRRALVRRAVEAGCATKVLVVARDGRAPNVAADEDWAGPIRVVSPAEVNEGGIDLL